jgi:hypothetical protein
VLRGGIVEFLGNAAPFFVLQGQEALAELLGLVLGADALRDVPEDAADS